MQVQMGSGLLSQQTVERTLQLVTELAVRTLPSAVAVSVTVQCDDGLQTAAATDNVARDLDEVQYATEHGPCVEALHRRVIINTSLRGAGDRWPDFVRTARASGMGSVLSVPLPTMEPSLGSLNIYSSASHLFTQDEQTTASLLAEQGAAALANVSAFSDAAAVNVQLLDALQTRDHIGQAKGILMERESCSAEAAFDILRRASQRTNRKLREVAEDLIRSVSERGTGD
jgi:GAF domain-containing protein